ncbi:ECF transporter S component [Levilactobacillus bambusae]|nr:ECF transporter S component [Levilactobacillus bambusae]
MPQKKGAARERNFRSIALALFIAIIIIQTIVPFLGYITLGPVSITLLQITTAIAAITLGTRSGVIVGTVWGVIEFVRSWAAPTTPFAALMMHNPFASILARSLVGLFAGLTYVYFAKRMKHKQFGMAAAGFMASFTNTFFVLLFTWLGFMLFQTGFGGITGGAWVPFLLGIAGANGIPELIASTILTPLIATPLVIALKRNGHLD